MREWVRKAAEAFPVSAWLLSLGVSYVLGTVVHDCFNSRYAEAAFRAGVVVYILPTFVALFRRHPNFRLLMQTNLFLGVTIAGWLVCFAWSWYKRLKTKHMLLSFIICLVVFGVVIDVIQRWARIQDAVLLRSYG